MRNGIRPIDINSICNICFVVAEENQSIGSKKPWKYLEPYKRKRYFGRVMQSHPDPLQLAASGPQTQRAGSRSSCGNVVRCCVEN